MLDLLLLGSDESYEDTVKRKLTENTYSIRAMEYGIRSDIRNSTYAIVASQQILAETYKQGFDSLNHTIDFGIARLSSEIQDLNDTISSMSEAICNKLDEIHDIVNNPLLTASRELFRRAQDNFNKGYYEEALEDAKSAVEKNKTDYISWYLLGQIYLFGAGKFSNVISLPKAEEALFNAAKYIDFDIKDSPEARQLASQIYYYLGYTKWHLSNDYFIQGNKEESNKKLIEAENSNNDSYKYNEKNYNALYERAKELHFLEKDSMALECLKKCIKANKAYALRASCDKYFESIWNKIEEIINELKKENIEGITQETKAENIIESEILNKFYPKKTNKIIQNIKNEIKKLNEDELDYFTVLEKIKLIKIYIQEYKELSQKAEKYNLVYQELVFWNKLVELCHINKNYCTTFITDTFNKSDKIELAIPLYYEKEKIFENESFLKSKKEYGCFYIKDITSNTDNDRFFQRTYFERYSYQLRFSEKFKEREKLYKDAKSIYYKDVDEDLKDCMVDTFIDINKFIKFYIKNNDTESNLIKIEGEKFLDKSTYNFIVKVENDYYSKGCYVATCVYGSYDCPEVWTLRRFRDNTLGNTWYGRLFIKTYYAISPTIVKWFGNTQWFKQMWKPTLDRMVKSLKLKGVQDTPYEDKNWK